ncbi:MAG TPA: DUF4190 domain-containing protein [Pseudonocardiaceae bacterium]
MTQSTITPPAQAAQRNGFGVTALVLGIVGAVFSWVPVLGLILAVLAVVFGALGYARARKGQATNSGMAIAGLVLGVIAFVIQIIVFAAVGTAANQASKDLGGSPSAPFSALPSNNAEHDVVITKCGGDDQLGMNSVTVRITNSTDRTQSYFVTASMNDAAGNRLGEANGASNSVAPGQSANAQLIGTGAQGAAQCTVANVTRFAS